VAGFVFRFLYFQATKMTPEKNRFMVKLKLKPFFGEMKRQLTEGSRGNGFKSDQRSHNNQNLLNDLFFFSFHGLKTRKISFYSCQK
jgi:hypothetical protein